MVFRAPHVSYRSGTIVYGPFPIRLGMLPIAIVALLFSALFWSMIFEAQTLACASDGSCNVTHVSITGRRTRSIAAVRDVWVDHHKSSKDAAVVLVIDPESADDGERREFRLMRTEDSLAEEAATSVRTGIAMKQPFDVTVHRSRWLVLGALLALGIGIVSACSALKGLGRFHLEILRGGAALRVVRRVFGLPISSREVSLEGVADVVVEGGELRERWRRNESGPAAGRIVLVYRTHERRPITEAMFPGEAVHLRAASKLRELLELDRYVLDVEEQLAGLSKKTTPRGTRFALAWLGVTLGSLVGTAIFGSVGIAIGLIHPKDGPGVWAFALGGGGGALAGVALVLYLTRPRPLR